MAELREVRVPDIGNFDQVAVIDVLVRPGASVKAEDPLITLESDKASMDVPSPLAGTVKEVKVKAGDKVGKDALIAVLEVAEQAAPAPPGPGGSKPAKEPPPPPAAATPAPSPPAALTPALSPGERETAPAPGAATERTNEPIDEAGFARAYAGPAVRRFARELGADLGKVKGSGRGGRILKEDVQAHVKSVLQRAEAGPLGMALPEMPAIDFAKFGAVERVALGRIKRLTGTNLHRAWVTVPHVTQFDEADITELEEFRKSNAAEAQARGFKLTMVAFLMKASVAALRAHPAFNSSLEPNGEHLVLKKYFHVGVAVDTPDGLVVPVVCNADRKGLFELAQELAEVSQRARDKRLKPDDLVGGCFTISSLGSIGGTGFTPIVNAPEVAILGASRATMRPVFRDGSFAPRLMLPLALSYDHRVIDGAQAARFITFLSGVLADIRRLVL